MATELLIDLHLVLRRGDRFLFGLRRNTGFSDGLYHLPAGRLEAHETVADGAIREAKEELGIDIDPADLHLVHAMLLRSGRLALFFEARKWSGELRNAEPDKGEQLDWMSSDRFPKNMVRYAVAALHSIGKGETISAYGWD